MKATPEPFTQLVTPRLLIRRFREEDLATLLAYRNDPEIARYQGWSTTSPVAAQAFIAEMQTVEPYTPGGGFQFAVELTATGVHIGDLHLRLMQRDVRQATIGYTLARAYHGHGYGSEAVSALLDDSFGTRQLHRITATVDTRNIASVRLLERVGLRREGHFRQSYWDQGVWSDDYLYAVLREEWLGNTSF